MKKHICLINLEYPPISGPGIWRILAFAKYLSKNNYKVTVICSDRSFWHKNTDDSLLKNQPEDIEVHRIDSYFLNDFLEKLTRVRSKQPWFALPIRALKYLLRKLYPDQSLHWVIKSIRRGGNIFRDEAPDYILSSGPPHASHLAGYFLSRKFQCPWIMDYRDLWVDDDAQVRPGPYQKWLLTRIEKYFLKKCNAITCVSPSWINHLSRKTINSNGRIYLLRNGHDINPNANTNANTNTNTNPNTNIHYNGTFQKASNPLRLIRAISLLDKESQSKLKVSCTGLSNDTQKLINSYKIDSVFEDIGYKTHKESIEISKHADILLILVSRTNNLSNGVIPGKIYESIALKKHILCIIPINSDVHKILKEYGNFTSCDTSKVIEIRSSISKIIKNGISFSDDVPDYNHLFFKYSRENQTLKLIGILNGIDNHEV